MPYRYLEDVATADAAFEAWAPTLPELFEAAADAAANVMVEEVSAVERQEERPLDLRAESLDLLLFALMEELIYRKDAEGLLLRASVGEVVEEAGAWRLRGALWGEAIDPARHELLRDVKAVTLHRLAVERTTGGWRATAVLDV